jgi:AraC-like DNA-binding protein
MKLPITNLFRQLGFTKLNTSHSNGIHLSSEKIDLLILEMDAIMDQHRPFLNSGYSIKNLADDLHIHSYQLSGILNQHLGKNFNNYLNKYRVEHGKELIQRGDINNLNLKGLAQKCGFNNRNSFTAAFKKHTGYTPSIYNRLCKNIQLNVIA